MPFKLFRYWNINFKKLAYSSDADKHDSPHQTCIAVWLHTTMVATFISTLKKLKIKNFLICHYL